MGFLGDLVSKDGISVDPHKMNIVTRWEQPKVKSFLHLPGYYMWFMESFLKIVMPLICLTREGVNFIWNEAWKASFQELKRLMSAQVFVVPSRSDGLTPFTDTSIKSLATVLMKHDRVVQLSC